MSAVVVDVLNRAFGRRSATMRADHHFGIVDRIR
jgi:hypothetical protein